MRTVVGRTNTLQQGRSALQLLSFCCALFACAAGTPEPKDGPSAPADLRRAAAGEPELAASWLLAELLSPGGSSKQAAAARSTLDKSGRSGMFEDFARGLDDSEHGRLKTASDHFLKAAQAARLSSHPQAELLAWFAVRRAMALRSNTQGLWDRWREWTKTALKQPKRLGWRARDVLVDWWASEAWASATDNVERLSAEQFGCLGSIRLAGPFGDGSRASALVPFDAERPSPWPLLWPEDTRYNRFSRVLKQEQKGCVVSVDEPTRPGLFYAEALVQLPRAEEVTLVVADALKVWVNGEEVLNRDFRRFGARTQAGVGLRVPAGKNRVVAKLSNRETSIRLLRKDGTPLVAKTLAPLSAGAPLSPSFPARVAFNANPGFVASQSQGVESVAFRYMAAYLAHVDSEDGAATLLLEPLVKDTERATGVALTMAAQFVDGDPIYDSEQTDTLKRELYSLALERDPRLWVADLQRVKHLAKSKGMVDAVTELKALAERYEEVPTLLGALAKVYGELGWSAEHGEVVKLRAERFPENVDGLYGAAQLLEEEGQVAKAQILFEKIQKLDPDSEVAVGRALERRQFDQALKLLRRLSERRPKRKDLLRRIEGVKRLAGNKYDVWQLLEDAIERSPKSGKARLSLADARFAAGEPGALHVALVEALQKGANAKPLKSALDLVEGMTELEVHRLDGMQIIREYEAAGKHMPGTAARILDYMAVVVNADGASRSLEHEVIRLQSEEAIRRFAEHPVRGDLVLQMRVIKKDGRILEPEPIAGKPTVTFPHLEVGDYIETEQIFSSASTGGVAYDGPHWFFREKDVAYARSEFLLVSPAGQKLDIATTGNVSEPVLTHGGYYDTRRWRVDASPAAPNEPFSVPPQEYLPSVKASWGLNLTRHLRNLAARVQRTTPIDPRIQRIAESIVADVPSGQEMARAKALYHWVLLNVQQGEESDGRRVIVGKRGNQWRGFVTLCRSLSIPITWAVARSRLAPEPQGEANLAAQFHSTVLRVGGKKPVWLTIQDKHTPFGYVPAQIRGMPAHLLVGDGREKLTLPAHGSEDQVGFDAEIRLSSDGSAKVSLTQTYDGRLGANLRKGLGELAERRVRDVIETKILASALRGARLTKHRLEFLDEPDVPFVIGMEAEMAHFALAQGQSLRIAPPFTPRLSQFATLPTRQTAILLSSERRWKVQLRIVLPKGATVETAPPTSLRFGSHTVQVQDSFAGGVLTLDRVVQISAGRVPPEKYAEFVRFTREADSALASELQVALRRGGRSL